MADPGVFVAVHQMIKGGIHTRGGLPLFDARYSSWYGDDDFVFRVEQLGYEIHRVIGLPCDHLNEATMRHRPDLMARREDDRQLFVGPMGRRVITVPQPSLDLASFTITVASA